MPHVIERINAARAEGLDVAANVYPYAASSTSLSTLAPDWALEGGYAEFKKRLADPAQRARIAEALRAQFAKRGPKGIYITRIGNPALAQYEKHFVEEIAAMMNVAPEEAMMQLFANTNGSPSVIFFSMNEDDVQTALKQSFVSIGSDSGSPTPASRAAARPSTPAPTARSRASSATTFATNISSRSRKRCAKRRRKPPTARTSPTAACSVRA